MPLKQADLQSSIQFVAASVAILILCTGCQSIGPGQAASGAFGTLVGGLAGAAIGAPEGKSPEGALIGAVAGGTLGSVAGNAVDRSVERDRFEYQQALQQQRLAAVSVDQVIRMTQSGLGSHVIASQITSQGVISRPNIDELILLKNNGVDDLVIQALQSAPVAGRGAPVSQPIVQREIIRREPVLVESYGSPRFYGYRYRRRGCGPRAGFHVQY